MRLPMLSDCVPTFAVESTTTLTAGGSADGSGGSEPHHLTLSTPDWVVLACHLSLTVGVGLFVTSRKQSGDVTSQAARRGLRVMGLF